MQVLLANVQRTKDSTYASFVQEMSALYGVINPIPAVNIKFAKGTSGFYFENAINGPVICLGAREFWPLMNPDDSKETRVRDYDLAKRRLEYQCVHESAHHLHYAANPKFWHNWHGSFTSHSRSGTNLFGTPWSGDKVLVEFIACLAERIYHSRKGSLERLIAEDDFDEYAPFDNAAQTFVETDLTATEKYFTKIVHADSFFDFNRTQPPTRERDFGVRIATEIRNKKN